MQFTMSHYPIIYVTCLPEYELENKAEMEAINTFWASLLKLFVPLNTFVNNLGVKHCSNVLRWAKSVAQNMFKMC